MGTNYYVASKACECCHRYDEDLHIGKSSYGWAFSFQGYKNENLTTWNKWKEYLKNRQIVDEYGTFISYEDFVKMVETYKAPGFKREDGHVNLSHNEEGRKQNYFNEEFDWDDELGYSFGTRDFS